MKTFSKILIVLILTLLIAISGFSVFYFSVTAGEKLYPEKLTTVVKNVCVLDKNGEEIISAAGENEKTVCIADVPEKVRYAFIDVEDKRFYKHNGFDYKRIIGALLANIKSRSFSQGASTISQQLIKNTHLSHEKTLKRKLKEFKLTRKLERDFSKDQILEKYLNTIYFGHNCFGLFSASEFYFSKTPNELSIDEGAILAGLVRSPNNYSPFKHPESCIKRRDLVLSLMHKEKHLTDEEYKRAISQPLPTKKDRRAFSGAKFLNAVYNELEEIAEEKNFSIAGEIKIYTAFDMPLQTTIEKLALQTESDSTIAVLDSSTRLFKGYFSSVGEIKRSPGSLIKPLLVYAPALERREICPATPILDEKTDFSGYSPKNYDGNFYGYVSARDCLSKSLNVPAVKILNQTGVEKCVEYLKKMQLDVEQDDYSLALALGGMKNGFSLRSLIGAYATFANDGEYEPPSFIQKITQNGRTVYEKQSRANRVFSPETTFLTTDMLRTAATSGTAKKLHSLPFQIAAKTGTAGIKNKNTDAYTISYTKNDVVGVWLGNASNAPISFTGGGLPCNFAYQINEFLYEKYLEEDRRIPDFIPPSCVKKVWLDKDEYQMNRKLLLADENAAANEKFQEWFFTDSAPTKYTQKYINPTIQVPKIAFEQDRVKIQIANKENFIFRIERIENNKSIVLYEGEIKNGVFYDENIEKNKTYIYTVIPIFMNKEGTPIVLPKISTKGFSKAPPDIVYKDWWED